MITLIHGTDSAASRNYFLTEKQKHQDKATLDGTSLTLTDIMQATAGSGLFGEQETVFIEELLSKKKVSKDVEAIITYLASQKDCPIFIWESKELTAKQLQPFKGADIKVFSIPKTVFAFVDSIAPHNSQKMLALYHTLLAEEDAAFVLFMLSRQTRLLLALHEQGDKTISEVQRLAPWQLGKLKKQASLFSKEQLINLHNKLYQLEHDQKTGNLSLPLDDAIDFLLASL